LNDKNIPADEITLNQLAKQILETPPVQGIWLFQTLYNGTSIPKLYARHVSTRNYKIIDKVPKQWEYLKQIFHAIFKFLKDL
jgi:hypothetical protein